MGGQIDCQPKYPATNWACGVIDTTLCRFVSIALVLLGTACAAGCVIDRSTDRLLLQFFEELFCFLSFLFGSVQCVVVVVVGVALPIAY